MTWALLRAQNIGEKNQEFPVTLHFREEPCPGFFPPIWHAQTLSLLYQFQLLFLFLFLCELFSLIKNVTYFELLFACIHVRTSNAETSL